MTAVIQGNTISLIHDIQSLGTQQESGKVNVPVWLPEWQSFGLKEDIEFSRLALALSLLES